MRYCRNSRPALLIPPAQLRSLLKANLPEECPIKCGFTVAASPAVDRQEGRGPRSTMKTKSKDIGKLRIGDDWNAIRIIALSQSNPLKAIAEFVENSIDAHAKTITITRGKEHNAHYLADQG